MAPHTHRAQKQNIGENQIDHNFPAGQGVKERQDEAGGTAGGVGKGIAPGALGVKRNCEMGQRRGKKELQDGCAKDPPEGHEPGGRIWIIQRSQHDASHYDLKKKGLNEC